MIEDARVSEKNQIGFTIVELLIVVVVIAILAAITIVSFNGISKRATATSLQSDLRNSKSILEQGRVTSGEYASTSSSLKPSNGTTFEYSVDNSAEAKSFCLTATSGSTSYYIDTNSTPQQGACPGHSNGGQPASYQLAFTSQASAGTRSWWGLASSADGTRVAGAILSGTIVTSSDSGATFQTTSSGTASWYDVASSDDGMTLYAASAGASGNLRKSTNGGSSWATLSTAGTRDWRMVETSANGAVVVALPFSGNVFISTDSGATWTERTGPGSQNWKSVAVSSSGTDIYVGAAYNYYHTNNAGQNWAARNTGAFKLAVSNDGKTVYATNDYTFTRSTDYGNTVTAVAGLPAAGAVRFLSMSGDGTKVAAGLSIGGSVVVWASGNSGQNWTEQTNLGALSILSGQYSRNGQNLYIGPNSQLLQIGR